MKKSTLGILISLTCIFLLVSIVLATKPPKPQNASTTAPSSSYTAEQVATHATQEDCWMIIEGNVYNVSEYVESHPGGSEILRGCGKDATSLFNTRRDGNERVGSGSPHSSSATSVLESFKVGTLAN